jgi:hypothetical protein
MAGTITLSRIARDSSGYVRKWLNRTYSTSALGPLNALWGEEMNSTRPLVSFFLLCVILLKCGAVQKLQRLYFERARRSSACQPSFLSKQLELIERKATVWARQVRQQLVVNYQVSPLTWLIPRGVE